MMWAARPDESYEKYCFEHLPDEYKRLRSVGRTGTEAFIAAKSYENRQIAKRTPHLIPT